MAEEGFLKRWSRRKVEARDAPEEATAEEQQDAPAAALPSEPRAPEDEDGALDLEALPDIDSLTYESDFTVFMRKGVPPDLRRRALQKLWRSNPTLANLDGLVEYGEDYTKVGTVKQVVRTAYQVGRGMLERLEPRTAEDQPAGEEPAVATDETARLEGEGHEDAPAAEREQTPQATASASAPRPCPLPRRG